MDNIDKIKMNTYSRCPTCGQLSAGKEKYVDKLEAEIERLRSGIKDIAEGTFPEHFVDLMNELLKEQRDEPFRI